MCNCWNSVFKVENGKLYGEYDGDFHKYFDESYSYCPICGENLQPERLNPETHCKHDLYPEDFKEGVEGYIYRKCKKCNEKLYANVYMRCDSLNSMET